MNACAKAFGFCASKHLKIVIDKLEQLLTSAGSKKSRGALFGLLKIDSKSDTDHIYARCTILRCIGEVAINVVDEPDTFSEFLVKADELCQKFIMPAIQSAHPGMKLSALKTASDIARGYQRSLNNDRILGKILIKT